jgi:uncharacterized damage-inducible protein DinB
MAATSATSTSPRETETPLSLLYPDLDSEFAITRRILERVPDGKDDWRPHEKSMMIGGLATHIAQLPWFGVMIATRDEMDLMKERPPAVSIKKNAERLQLFDEASSNLKATLEKLTWDDVGKQWTFWMGDKVLIQSTRAILLRAMVLTHTTHHRAQLGVFLRLLGIPIPGSYGPSADEPIGAN